jgi:hypothetical protein
MNTDKTSIENANQPSCLGDVRRSALEWWNTLPPKTKKQITDTNKNILIKGIERTWQRLTDREVEKLYKVRHFA